MNTPAIALPENLFRIPVYLPYLQPELTPEAIADAQDRLGVTLPAAYLAALKIQNGGYLRRSAHESGHAPVDCLSGIGPRFPSILRRNWSQIKTHMAENGLEKPQNIDDLVPFCGDGHYHWCFDYRQHGRHKEPCITYIDVETFHVDEIVAPDFLTFLRGLQAEVEHAYGIVTTRPMAIVAKALSAATGHSFEDQDDQDSGYRIFRAKLPGEAMWAWLTPNRVKRGFVRRNDRDAKKMQAMMPGFDLRYPEHPDCGYFIKTNFSTKAGKALVKALGSFPFETRAVEID